MTLPAAFPLSVSQINVELNRAGGAAFDIQGSAERTLANISSGPISMSDFLGKSSLFIEQVDKRNFITGADPHVFSACSYGSITGRSGIVVLVQHGDIGSDPGLTPSCTISGVNANGPYQPYTTGTGAPGDAVGTVIFTGTPGGASGDISINWGNTNLPIGIIVLRAVGYNMIPAFTWGDGGNSLTASVTHTFAAKDAVIATKGSGKSSTDIVWTNITEIGDELNMGAGGDNRRSWAFDYNLGAGSKIISHTPVVVGNGQYSWSGVVLSAL